MPQIDLTTQDFESMSENVSRIKLSNMYLVENPLSLSGRSYIPRPTLKKFGEVANAKIRGIWYQSINGATNIYVVADQTLYRLNNDGGFTPLGTIPGTDFCTFASTIYNIAISANGGLYLFDGVSLFGVTIPDSNQVTDVTALDNYFIVGIKNSNRFYWIEPGGTTIDGLSFISAERNPDDIVSVEAIGDELWVIGQSTCEVFSSSGDINAPFVRISGRVYQTGCVDKHSVAQTLKNTIPCLIWITPSKEVVLSQGMPSKISNEAIEEVLKKAVTFTSWTFRTNRHDFYILNTDVATLVYDITANLWYRWSSYQKDFWNAISGIHINDTVYAVTDFDGKVYKLTYETQDSGGEYLVCEVGGFVPNNTRTPVSCSDITLYVNTGSSSSYIEDPLVELRWSDDGGKNWSAYVQGSMGYQGLYNTNVSFRSLGQINRPGRHIEIRFSELQSFRLDGATLND